MPSIHSVPCREAADSEHIPCAHKVCILVGSQPHVFVSFPRSTISPSTAAPLETKGRGRSACELQGAVPVTIINCPLFVAASAATTVLYPGTGPFWGQGEALDRLSSLCSLNFWYPMFPGITVRNYCRAPESIIKCHTVHTVRAQHCTWKAYRLIPGYTLFLFLCYVFSRCITEHIL